MRQILSFTIAATVLSGCTTVTPKSIDIKSSASLAHQTVAITTRSAPSFFAQTPYNAVFSLPGVLFAYSSGNDLIAQNQVVDPAAAIANGLRTALGSAQSIQVAAQPLAVTGDDANQIAQAARGKARFVVDVETLGWGFRYYSSAWSRYTLFYGARARLIDVDSGAIVAESGCSMNKTPVDTSPTHDELVANHAELIKQGLAAAEVDCVRVFGTVMFADLRLSYGKQRGTASATVQTSSPNSTITQPGLAPMSNYVAAAAPPVSPLQETQPSPQYATLLAAVQNSHANIDPSSYWYRPEAAEWVAARKGEFMRKGASSELALQRAIDSMDHF